MNLEDCLAKIKEDLASMMGTFPDPAIALVTLKDEKKVKHEEAEVDKSSNGLQKEV